MITKSFVAPALPLPPKDYSVLSATDQIRVLRLYFNYLDDYLLTLATPLSGLTADRPTTNLVVGDYYFDTDLNLPIWYDGTDWIWLKINTNDVADSATIFTVPSRKALEPVTRGFCRRTLKPLLQFRLGMKLSFIGLLTKLMSPPLQPMVFIYFTTQPKPHRLPDAAGTVV
jgi:hypothetical protein